jgi:hypothetical protein
MKYPLNPNGDGKFLDNLGLLIVYGGRALSSASQQAEVSHPQGVFINSQYYKYVSPSDAL